MHDGQRHVNIPLSTRSYYSSIEEIREFQVVVIHEAKSVVGFQSNYPYSNDPSIRFQLPKLPYLDHQIYCHAANEPSYGTAAAVNVRQSFTLPVGTVALFIAANTCHDDGFSASSGQAMNPSAPKPLKDH